MIELIEYVGNASKICHRTLRREFFSIFAATYSYMPMQNKNFKNLEITNPPPCVGLSHQNREENIGELIWRIQVSQMGLD